MKLNKSHIGQKFRQVFWEKGAYILLLAISSSGMLVVENDKGEIRSDLDPKFDFVPYEEPKEEVLMSPALVKIDNEFWPLKIVLKNVKTEQGFFERMEAEFYVEVEK